MKAPRPANEAQRLDSLRSYDVLDTPAEAAFDDLTLLAAQACGVPTAMISLVDENRQWFKSKIGCSAAETSRETAFCAHTILCPHRVLEVRDAEADPRFANSPLVTEDPHIRFYAGAPLVTDAGHALGALCVMDTAPRSLTNDQLAALEALSRRVVAQLEFRRQARELVAREQDATRLLELAKKSGRALLGVLEDEKLAARNLRESEERFRRLIENASDMIAIVGDDGVIRYQSPSTPRLLGYSASEMLGRPAGEFIHSDDRAKVGEAIQQAVAAHDKPVTVEFRIQHKDGTWRVLQSIGKRMLGATGKPQIVVNSRDVTEHRALEQQFLRAQRLEAIGTLASGVAHDLNNILTPMLMAAGLLQNHVAGETERRMLSLIEQSAQRGAGIISQLLAFSRGVEGERIAIKPAHLIREMFQFMQETFPRSIEIGLDVPGDLWQIVADATQVHQILLNLCVNARDAMPKGGCLRLTALNRMIDEKTALRHVPAKPGPYLAITVSDTGQGIPAEVMPRIFDPFFTTKGIGKGTGLGLSTVIGIVKSHEGFVAVESQPGQGTEFRIFLPALTDPTAPAPSLAADPPVRGHGELIMVVDDEAAIREAMGGLLEAYHYRVIKAESGEEAMRLLIKHRGSIRLLLTDMMMPGMDGLALIRALHRVEPAIKVIAVSGLDQEDRRAELVALGVKEILPKPFTPTVLLHAIARQR